ncbi:MAG TPA: exosortase/archaeosortase family protein [Lacunisphaera sp.]|jgi:exosortase
MTGSATVSPLASSPPAVAPRVRALIAVLLVFTIAYCARLWPEWVQNPDLSHGFFAPIIFVLLIAESRRNGAQCWLSESRSSRVATATLALAGFVLFALAGLLAASVAWNHALVLFVLGLSLCSFLLAGWLILSDGGIRLLPFNWISFTAIFLWLLVAPLPNGTYARITLGLQTGVTGAVFHTLHLLGIPAQQHGNVIELARTTVGVEETCSGIRSLLSCVYAGFFFAAWLVRKPGSRAILIITAPMLALAMNFLRSLLLTLLANSGRDITGAWHDVTGYAILTLTSALLAWMAISLGARDISAPAKAVPPTGLSRQKYGSMRFFWTTICATLALGAFYFAESRPAKDVRKPMPDLASLLPVEASGWEVTTARDLHQFSSVLQTTHLIERTYVRRKADGQPVQFTIYVAYWPAGQTTVSRVASHTPDACWPGSGWVAKPVNDSREVLAIADVRLYPAEHRFFQNGAVAQNVWFWHVYDGQPINYRDPYSVPALLELAWKYGFRHQGDQCFIRISSNQPWSGIANEPLLGSIVANFATLGL